MEGLTKNKVPVDTKNFIKELSVGLKNPSRNEKRFIVLNSGSELIVAGEVLLLFEGMKLGDYHEETNAFVLEKTFCKYYGK